MERHSVFEDLTLHELDTGLVPGITWFPKWCVAQPASGPEKVSEGQNC